MGSNSDHLIFRLLVLVDCTALLLLSFFLPNTVKLYIGTASDVVLCSGSTGCDILNSNTPLSSLEAMMVNLSLLSTVCWRGNIQRLGGRNWCFHRCSSRVICNHGGSFLFLLIIIIIINTSEPLLILLLFHILVFIFTICTTRVRVFDF
ncbi:hypothetical protein Hdeb2414_s0024g00647181 [Helianthus debilis subsp. tardiflorus]